MQYNLEALVDDLGGVCDEVEDAGEADSE
jgi:hypothetical protein